MESAEDGCKKKGEAGQEKRSVTRNSFSASAQFI